DQRHALSCLGEAERQRLSGESASKYQRVEIQHGKEPSDKARTISQRAVRQDFLCSVMRFCSAGH
ncbi:MAG: hypothetical protein Q8M64_11015, partial [Methyloversatilis sp.]|nr:hypothetical protein [Methyloversatilis sp.]